MADYKGFGFEGQVPGMLTVYASGRTEAGAWAGKGYVGTMPNRHAAKLYVDWLREQSPDCVHEMDLDIPDSRIRQGHAVVTNADWPDSKANICTNLHNLSVVLARSADMDIGAFTALMSDLTWTVRDLEIANQQRGAVLAIDNFILADADDDGLWRLYLGNFGLPGEWNGGGLVAAGLGRGWVQPLTEFLLRQSPAPLLGTGCYIAGEALPRYARLVFVEGPEPHASAEQVGDLKSVVRALAEVRHRRAGDPSRQAVARQASAAVGRVAEDVRKTVSAGPRTAAPSDLPQPQ